MRIRACQPPCAPLASRRGHATRHTRRHNRARRRGSRGLPRRLPTSPRLKAELPRTTNQLRQAAAAARDRSWRLATIDSANNLRSGYASLGGAVVVIGPNNFPLAFNAMA